MVSQVEGKASIQDELSHGEVFLLNLSLGLDRDKRGDIFIAQGDIPDFHLDPAPQEKTGFSLSLEVRKGEKDRIGEEKERKDLGLSRLVSNGLSSLRFERAGEDKNARRTSTSGGGQQRLSPSIDFDFSPWAKEVVDKIRTHWTVPPIEKSMARGKVKISIVIAKDGTLMELEVMDASDFALFDESAVQAIRSSAPFIPLPENFPGNQLETYLVFEFNE